MEEGGGKSSSSIIDTDIDEKSISAAMRARVPHFKEQADSLTLEGVRRVLEKDLGLDIHTLDTQKRFIKKCLQECFDAGSNENVSKSSGETGEEVINSTKEETLDLSDNHSPVQTSKELEDKEKVQESPAHGGLAGVDTVPDGTKKIEVLPRVKAISEETVKNSVRKRASYFRDHSETLTLADVRRLLEKDLKLDIKALDPYRELVKKQLDSVLQGSGATEPANGVKNKKRKKGTSGGDSDSSDSVDEEVKPKKKIASKQKMNATDVPKNRKGPSKEAAKSSNKQTQPAESISEESDDAKDGGDLSDDGQSQSSSGKPIKKRSETSTQVYGKHVEHLRSVLKSCNLNIPPTVYKRVKQEPESKREACLVKELEAILKKEGLSTNPSEKEIMAVRRQKERIKELEGIDLGNIVQSSRRRSTSSFVPPPKPKIPSESDDDGEDNHEGTEDEDDDDNEDDNADETDDEGPDDSNSEEEFNEDVDDDSD